MTYAIIDVIFSEKRKSFTSKFISRYLKTNLNIDDTNSVHEKSSKEIHTIHYRVETSLEFRFGKCKSAVDNAHGLLLPFNGIPQQNAMIDLLISEAEHPIEWNRSTHKHIRELELVDRTRDHITVWQWLFSSNSNESILLRIYKRIICF